MTQGSKKKRGDNIGLAGKVVIVLFAVLMALSLMLPSLAAIFGSSSSDSSESTQTSSSSSDSSADSTSTASDTTVEGADAKYGAEVEPLEEKHSADPTDLATLLNLGKDYMAWGVRVRYYGSTDDDTTHANELLSKAVGYYDEYLALKDSDAVKVDRALCAYYQEDTASATEQLEALTESSPDYGPAWANLGMLYEAAGDTDAAKDAYTRAQAADADDAYGAKTYATQRLSAIQSSEESASSGSSTGSSSTSTDSSSTGTTSGTGSTSTTTGVQGLSQTLGNLSGTGL